MEKEKAVEKWQEYIEEEQTNNSKQIRQLRRIYYYLKQGKRVVDIYESFKKCPLNEDGEPRLAIAPANAKNVRLVKHDGGAGTFRDFDKAQWGRGSKRTKNEVRLPAGTFQKWKVETGSDGNPVGLWNSQRRNVSTIVPMIPAKHIPKNLENDYGNYFVLWEVEKWEPEPPRDPVLLRRMSPNIFVVLAQWNLTKLERAFIRGNL
jgi:hypothetical protein